MKFVTSRITALFALVASCTIVTALQSDPFYLVIVSGDSKLNGHILTACHEGAAIEGLCKGSKLATAKPAYETYRFNYSRSVPHYGQLTYKLTGENFVESEPMNLYFDPSTNVALPLFEPGYGDTYVSFDNKNQLYIKTYIDDTVNPPTQKNRDLYRWYMCKTYYSGNIFETLSWVQGTYPPENPSCEKVRVKRVFQK